jgi:hypothetical protein
MGYARLTLKVVADGFEHHHELRSPRKQGSSLITFIAECLACFNDGRPVRRHPSKLLQRFSIKLIFQIA